MPERDLVAACRAYIHARGGLTYRLNAGVVPQFSKGRRYAMHLGEKGAPDIVGVLPSGRFIGVECKRRPNKPTAEQLRAHAELRACGALVVVAYSIIDVQKALDGL